MKVKHVKHFILLLLDKNISKNQARALIETADARQVLALCEVLLNVNIHKNTLSRKISSLLEKHQSIVIKLSQNKRNDKV